MKTLASDLIGNLTPELPENNAPFARKMSLLEDLVRSFKQYAIRLREQDFEEYDEEMPLFIPSVNNEEMQLFYDLFTQNKILQDFQVGIAPYMSRLFNKSSEKVITFTPRSGEPGLGERFGTGTAQALRINGDVGVWTGRIMNSGTIYVNGSAGSFTGERMMGGNIIISKDVKSIGTFTEGTIRCSGHCAKAPLNVGTLYAKSIGKIEEDCIEFYNRGGRIHVQDGIGEISNECQSTIFLKGKKYWERGKKV